MGQVILSKPEQSPQHYLDLTYASPRIPPDAGLHFDNRLLTKAILYPYRRFTAPVEGELDGGIEVAYTVTTPRNGDLYAAWQPIWFTHEFVDHFGSQKPQADALGIKVLDTIESKVNVGHKLAGAIGERNETAYWTIRLAEVAVIGVGEYETGPAYVSEAEELAREGERQTARFSGATAAQEFLHLNFLWSYALELADRMPLKHKNAAGWFVKHFFESVGVRRGDAVRGIGFGHLLRIATDDEGEMLAAGVANMLSTIFPAISPDDPFAKNKYQQYIRMSKKAYPALIDDRFEVIEMARTIPT